MAFIAVAAAVPAAASRPARATPGTQHFTVTSRTIGGIDQPTLVVAAGPIRGHGPVKVPATAGRVNRFSFELPRESVNLIASEKNSSSRSDLQRCVKTETGHGSFRIKGGTRQFRTAAGQGGYTRHTTIHGARDSNGKCLGESAPPVSIVTVTQMRGKTTLG